jgi:hypothetical protein
MHLVSLLLIVFVLVSSFQENEKPAKDLDFARILPKEFSLGTPLESPPWARRNDHYATIGHKLFELGAYVRNGKIFDRDGKQIFFVKTVGRMSFSLLTWESNNKPPEYQPGTLEEKGKLIEKLEKNYTLIKVSVTLK